MDQSQSDGLREQVRQLQMTTDKLGVEKASKESVANLLEAIQRLDIKLDRATEHFDRRVTTINTALLTGAIAWLVGSGMLIVAVLQLAQ